MERRQFLKMVAGAGASVAAVSLLSSNSFAKMTQFNGIRSTESKVALPIPPVLANTSLHLQLQTGMTIWRVNNALTWGVNGHLLGPVIRAKRGQTLAINVTNQLPETSTLHWHGLLIPGESDGGPHAMIEKGATWQTSITVDQPAATCWYHPHPHHRSGYHVAMGLGGLFIIDDEQSDALPLPKTWGVDDIPIVLQDKRLNAQGQIDYHMDAMTAAMGWFGEMMLTNGVEFPHHRVPTGWVRLRLLNGCNARPLHLVMSDHRPFYVIASDGGLLAEPVKMVSLEVLMGERFDILVDTRGGGVFDLLSLPNAHMMMSLPPTESIPVLRLQPTSQLATGILPDVLASLPTLPTIEGLSHRHLALEMDRQLDHAGMSSFMHCSHGGRGDGHGMMSGLMNSASSVLPDSFDLYQANRINGRAFSMKDIAFTVPQGSAEIWHIDAKGDMMLHPFHVHGTQFRILQENGRRPALHRQGWKDIVKVDGGESIILVKFDHLASPQRPYMAHCHLLEHEDTGMMLSFSVV